MVKIVNTLGEFKTGVQGEAVYQGKYGQQIRRQVSPKRAIPSQRQIEHRQFYRDALAWRKQLSPPNRRYLDGYCIANWIIDSYGIPLAWSRFALKLYLQAIQFDLIKKPTPAAEGVNEKKQSYIETDKWNAAFGGDAWKAQTFLTTDAYTITSVKLQLRRFDYPGFMTVSIRDTSGGKPTGPDLTVGTTDGDTLPVSPDWELRQIDLTPYPLQSAHLYAIVVRRATEYPPGNPYWAGRNDAPLYAEGMHCYSANAGATWNDYGDATDLMFETWTLAPGEPGDPGLIHIKHPALLTVVHRRGELSIKAYDTLSSLDEEYLTKQVGLDVAVGDLIEVTTLPGVEGTYLVK
ncbi:hypothetical protein ES707_22039 [subsurface metagenome]